MACHRCQTRLEFMAERQERKKEYYKSSMTPWKRILKAARGAFFRQTPLRMKIGVIGAGAAGLCAVKTLVEDGHSVVCYERDADVGGTWRFSEDKGRDRHGLPVHSSMYRFLRTNLPKEVMAFPGYPFPEQEQSFIGHEDVLSYLLSYAKDFDLKKHIKFGHHVVSVRPLPSSRWELRARDVVRDAESVEEFDALFVCNGHYFEPYDPHIPGYDQFRGLKMHCHDFRDESELKNVRRLALIGAGPSGWDLAAELANRVEKVYLLARMGPRNRNPKMPENVERKPEPSRCSCDAVEVATGEKIPVDGIMLCTGYLYSFPFLSPDCGISVKNQRVSPLYKHCVNIRHPTMFFIGVVSTVIPFVVFHFQTLFCANVLKPRNGYALPDAEAMLFDAEQEMEKRSALGWPRHYYHKMAQMQFDYVDDLAELCGARKVAPVVERLYNEVGEWRNCDLFGYKDRKFRIVDEKDFVDVTGDGKRPDVRHAAVPL